MFPIDSAIVHPACVLMHCCTETHIRMVVHLLTLLVWLETRKALSSYISIVPENLACRTAYTRQTNRSSGTVKPALVSRQRACPFRDEFPNQANAVPGPHCCAEPCSCAYILVGIAFHPRLKQRPAFSAQASMADGCVRQPSSQRVALSRLEQLVCKLVASRLRATSRHCGLFCEFTIANTIIDENPNGAGSPA